MNMEMLENIQTPEKQEKYTSKIKLMFFRHAEKESDKSKANADLRLTSAGKKQAAEKNETENIRQSLAFGGPKVRTQETAGLAMSGGQAEINGEETLAELKNKLDSESVKGSKIGVDKRLDFSLDYDSEFGKASLENYKRGEYLKFLVEQSDELAEAAGDKTSFTYSKGAANVASIIDKYLRVAKRWDELVQDEQKEYEDTLERFLSTHQGVGESFLAKVIEKIKGTEERDKFIKVLNNSGFDFTEGFEADILNRDSEKPIIHITYKKELSAGDEKETVFEFDEEVPRDVIDQIIMNK